MTSCSDGAPVCRAVKSKRCLHCGQERVKNRCGGCRAVYFCDRECQRLAWPRHRPHCGQLGTKPSEDDARPTPIASTTSINTISPSSVPATTTSGESNTRAAGSVEEQQQQKKKPIQEDPIYPVQAKDQYPQEEESQVTRREEKTLPAETQHRPQETTSPTPSGSKRHKKKKLKKKKRSSSYHGESNADTSLHQKNRSSSLPSCRKHLTWGAINVREFTRFPGGGSTVPYDGTWALGLGQKLRDVQLGSVAEFEEQREKELKQRAKQLSKSVRPFVRECETRQFDYCRGVSNPLFSRLSERERKLLFTEDTVSHAEVKVGGSKHRHKQTPIEEDDNEEQHVDFACVSIEQLDEFAKIRDSREACGCSCGDLVRKVAKMNVKKLHHFLQERNVEVKVHSKPELLALAKAIAREEKNCSNSSECECLKNGIACHQLVCSGCARSCANPFDSYTYNREEITQYRQSKLTEWRIRGSPDAPVSA